MADKMNFSQFVTLLSEQVGYAERSKTPAEMQNEADAELCWDILRNWGDTSKVGEYSADTYHRILEKFIQNVEHDSMMVENMRCVCQAADGVKRAVVTGKRRIL